MIGLLYTPEAEAANDFTGILPDIGADGGTQFQGGGSKDNNDINQWLWKAGEPLDKDDITNAYAAAYVGGPDNHLYIFYGLDRFAKQRICPSRLLVLYRTPILVSQVLQVVEDSFFSGVHQLGDLLIQSNFTQGGVISNISVFEWVGSGGGSMVRLTWFSAHRIVLLELPQTTRPVPR